VGLLLLGGKSLVQLAVLGTRAWFSTKARSITASGLSMANCYFASHAFAATTPSPHVHPCNACYKAASYVTHFKSPLSFGEGQV
jgi:hypothetical protein